MTISRRLIFTLSIALMSMIFVGWFGIWQLSRAQQRFESFQSNVTQAVDDLSGGVSALYKNRVLAYRYATQTDAGVRATITQAIADNVATMRTSLDKYERDDVTDSEDRALLEKDKATLIPFLKQEQEFIDLVKNGEVQAALALQEDGAPLRVASLAVQGALEGHIKYNVDAGRKLRLENSSAYSQSLWILIFAVGGATLVSGGMGLRLQRTIRASLGGVQQALEAARENLDLTREAPVGRMDEIGRTATAFNDLQGGVREVMRSVRVAANSVAVASREIASGNADLSSRTEEQAASLEETASSMTQLTETVKQNADNAKQANMLASNATHLADSGNESVVAMVDTIRKISESSDKISEITGVIEGIAFQTNILALNAAVEAARAGEQGRGFAVVASEVRGLAQRSSTAAKEIKGLIEASVTTVQGGAQQAAEVGVTMGQVKQAIKQVSDIVGEIAAASDEQKTGIEQINRAVSQMDEVTQQNAALVEQAAAAAQSLDQQAGALNDSVAQFKLGDSVNPQGLPTRVKPVDLQLPLDDRAARRQAITREIIKPSLRVAGGSQRLSVSTAEGPSGGDWQAF